MSERTGVVTVRGNPITLVGNEVKVGDKAPDFKVVGEGLKSVTLADAAGSVRVFCTVFCMDTPI